LGDFILKRKKNIFIGPFSSSGGCKFFYSGLLIVDIGAERLELRSTAEQWNEEDTVKYMDPHPTYCWKDSEIPCRCGMMISFFSCPA